MGKSRPDLASLSLGTEPVGRIDEFVRERYTDKGLEALNRTQLLRTWIDHALAKESRRRTQGERKRPPARKSTDRSVAVARS